MTNAQLTAEVDALSAKVTQMKNLLALFMVNGLADAFDGTGNQTFGGGRYRLNRTGLQIIADNGTTDPPGLFWLPSFLPSIPYTGSFPIPAVDQWAGVVGDAQAGDNWVALEARRLSGTQPSYAFAQAYADGGSSFVQLKSIHNNGSQGKLTVWGESATDPPVITVDGALRIKEIANLTIASGVVAVKASFHGVDTEGAAGTDDLDTINGVSGSGQLLILRPVSGARTIVAKDGTGNLKLAGDFTMDNAEDTLLLINDGTNWLELSRSDNGA